MARITVECADPNDLQQIERAVLDGVGKCVITYFKQHKAMVAAGVSESERESARIMAEETGESAQVVRRRIQRGKNELAQDGPEKETQENQEDTSDLKKLDFQHGGKREGAGRPTKPKLKHKVKEKINKADLMSDDFKTAFDEFYREVQSARVEHWKSTSREAALLCAEMVSALITAS